jgi:hypothetical protein
MLFFTTLGIANNCETERDHQGQIFLIVNFLVMSLSSDQYLLKLINKILFSGSLEEVIGYCDEALKGFEDQK